MHAKDPRNEKLYGIVYEATRDAFLNVIGTIVYAALLVYVLFIGLAFVIQSGTALSVTGTVFTSFLGLLIVIAAALQLLQLFDRLPSWLKVAN